MTGRETLDKYTHLDKSCLTDIEKEEVRDMLHEYKDAFSLRDKIDMPQYRSGNRHHRQDLILH